MSPRDLRLYMYQHEATKELRLLNPTVHADNEALLAESLKRGPAFSESEYYQNEVFKSIHML